MGKTLKYLLGSSSILYTLCVLSALLLGYWDWWVALVAVLGLASFGLWRRVRQSESE